MTRLHQRHVTPILGLALILFGFAALVFEWSPSRTSFQPLPESILASTTGAIPSWHNYESVGCTTINIREENDTGEDPPLIHPFVAFNDCEGNDGSPCISCPTATIAWHPLGEKTDAAGGLRGAIDSVDCGTGGAFELGTKGTCDNGVCEDKAVYSCDKALAIYQMQSGNPGG